MVDEVAARLDHLDEDAVAIVACSGGPDSTALAYLTAEARPDLQLILVHVRHGLRDDAADAAIVRQHASWLGVDHLERDVEVVRDGRGTEAAARRARYAALREVAADRGATTILVGHSADDQAETVLLRIARGTGLDGLGAMAPVADDLTRPLLRLRRDDVRRFVALEGLPSADDPTNRDRSVRRAVVRHDVLPRLADVGPDPVGALCRLADLARQDADGLRGAAAPLGAEARWVGTAVLVPAKVLRRAPQALATRTVRALMTRITGGPPPSAATVARVLAAPRGDHGASLPHGVELVRTRGWWALADREVGTSAPQAVPDREGSVTWTPAGRVLRVVVPTNDGEDEDEAQLLFDLGDDRRWNPPTVGVAPAAIPPGVAADRLVLALPELPAGALVVRHRRPGDRIATPGGTARLAKLATEVGLPLVVRDRWPVVVWGERVVWYPGVAADGELLAAGRTEPARLLVLDLPPGRDGGPER